MFSFQYFYEVEHDEERMLEIEFGEGFLVEDFLTLIPEEAYKLHLMVFSREFLNIQRVLIIFVIRSDCACNQTV